MPIIIFLAYSKEEGHFILMTLITTLPYVLLKTFYSSRVKKYNINKIMANIYYYSLVLLITLFVLATLVFGYIY